MNKTKDQELIVQALKARGYNDIEIYVTEGDSASGNLKMARDNEFQAVMPVRSKAPSYHRSSICCIECNTGSCYLTVHKKQDG